MRAAQRIRAAATPRMAVRAAAVTLLAGLALAVGHGAARAQVASEAPAGCKGVSLAVIPAQGVISNPGQAEGGHLWWRTTPGGTCIGTVIEDVRLTVAAPTRALRVIVYDQADPGGLTVASTQVTGSGAVSRAFGIHQVFAGLTAVCLAATSPVVTSPDMPCLSFGQPAPARPSTQPLLSGSQVPVPFPVQDGSQGPLPWWQAPVSWWP